MRQFWRIWSLNKYCIVTTICIYIYAETKSTIMTNKHTSLEKYTAHTLFEMVAKGLYVRGELETEQTATYWPQVPLSLAAFLSRSAGLLNGGSWGPIALCSVLVLSTAPYLQLTQPVCGTGLYNWLRKIYLSLYWKGCVWEGVGDRTELQHIDPYSYGHNSVSFPFSWAAQPAAWGPNLSRRCSHSSIFSPSDLISNWLNFLCTELYNCSLSTFFSWASQIALNSTSPRSRLYPDIPQPDAPVIYTGAFPILTAWPGSICYTDLDSLLSPRHDALLFTHNSRNIVIINIRSM